MPLSVRRGPAIFVRPEPAAGVVAVQGVMSVSSKVRGQDDGSILEWSARAPGPWALERLRG